MDVVFLSLLTLFASFIGTLAGFGSSTIMLPVVVLFLPFQQALLLVGIVHLFNDIWQILLFKHAVRWKLLLTFGIPGAILTIIGASFALSINPQLALQALGVVLVLYVILLMVDPKFRLPHNSLSAGVGGSLSGFIAGIIGVGGPIRSMFLSAYKLPKETYLFTIGATALMVDIPRLMAYRAGGATLSEEIFKALPILIIVSFAGAELAKKVVHRVPKEKFRAIVSALLLLAGMKLILYP